MKNRIFFIKAIVITIFILTLPVVSYSINIEEKKIYKVGFYNDNPYYFVNNKGNLDGYYHELLETLGKDLNIKYEYVELEITDCIEKLETGEIDLVFGISRDEEREKKFIYTDHYIAIESYGIYTNKHIKYGNLQGLNNLKFGIIEKESNSEWIISFLKQKNINVTSVKAKGYEELINLLINKEIDATISRIENNQIKSKNKVFEYSVGPVYIATSKQNLDLAISINKWLEDSVATNNSNFKKIQDKYLGKTIDNKTRTKIFLFILILIILISIFMFFKIYPIIKKKIIKIKIRQKISQNKFLIHYQPIIDPKKEQIVAFEALIRLKDDKKGILTPYFFLSEIQENDMISELSLWILDKILEDYNTIKSLNDKLIKDFYISMNICTSEIENTIFVDLVKDKILKSNLNKQNICMEIVETYKINDLIKIQESIKELKECGIKIAVDDFGVENSNLDIIEKIDFDIMKLDKYFIDNIECSIIRREIIIFLSNIAQIKNSVIIAEGVENLGQKEVIKNINYEKFYIQGYFYSKPLSIENIKYIEIK